MEEAIRSTGGSITSLVRSVLGTYNPTDPSSMAGADWEYIASASLLLLTFYFMFKLISFIFKK